MPVSSLVMSRHRSEDARGIRARRVPWEPLIFLGLVVALVGSGTYLYLQQGRDNEGQASGDGAALAYLGIDLREVDGGSFNLSQYVGKVVLLDLFATWCGPCMTQINELKEVRSRYSENELVMISVDVDTTESIPEVRALKEEKGMTWMVAMSNSRFSKAFPASSIPTMYYLDMEGKVADKVVGTESASEVMDRIDRILTR